MELNSATPAAAHAGLLGLSAVLRDSPSLVSVQLASCGLESRHLLPLVAEIQSSPIRLKELDLSNAGEAAQMLFETFSENDFEALIRELLESATVEHEGHTIPLMPVFDVVMAGKPGTILKLLKFALEVNYGSFFGGFLGSVGQLAGKA